MLLALLLAAALPTSTPDPAVLAQVDRWEAAAVSAEEAGDASRAAANLWRAAEAADKKLRDYDRALALYGRLAEEYPAARLTRGALARREYVARAIAGGAEPFRRFERVRDEFAKLGSPAAREEVASILEDHPDFALADEALLWLADRAYDDHDARDARVRYRELIERFPESPLVAHAWAGLGRAAFAEKDWAAAEEAYARIAETSVAGAALVSRREVKMVRQHRIRAGRLRWVLGFLAVAGVLAIATVEPRRLGAAARRAVGRELLFAGPVFLLLVLIAPSDGRFALASIACAGIAILLAAVIWAEAARPAVTRPGLRVACTALGTAAGAAVLYVVLYALDLLVAVERLLGEA